MRATMTVASWITRRWGPSDSGGRPSPAGRAPGGRDGRGVGLHRKTVYGWLKKYREGALLARSAAMDGVLQM